MKTQRKHKPGSTATPPSPLTAGRWMPGAGPVQKDRQPTLTREQTRNQTRDQTRLAVIQAVFTPAECLQLITEFTPQLQPASVESMNAQQSASVRKSSAVFIFPTATTAWVFERLGQAALDINDAVYGFDVEEFREGFQFTRYDVDEHYGPHFDIGPGKLAERKLSMTVQLTAPDDYAGGELIIAPEFVAPREQGTMTVFPSFMCHHVSPVQRGVRYSLVSWLAGPPFR